MRGKRGEIIFSVLILVLFFVSAFWLFAAREEEAGRSIYSALRLVDKVLVEIHSAYVDPLDLEKLMLAGIRGFFSALDPYSQFFQKEEYEEMKIDTRGKFEGIGIVLGIRDNRLTVISPIEGGPSYKLGIKAGDKIMYIDNKSTKGMGVDDAVRLLRGPKGTVVTVKVKREGEPELIEYVITRDVIEIKAVPYWGMTADSIGYIRLARYSDNATREVREAIRGLEEMNVKGIILDLRSNPGGLLREAVGVASLFLEEGSLVVFTMGQDSTDRRDYRAYSRYSWTEKPLVVIVDKGSASASEITAGAIQDNDRGVILGERTFGKGLVQSIIPLPENNALKLTTAKYYIPSGRSIQKEDYLKKPTSAILSRYSKEASEEDSSDEEDEEEQDEIPYRTIGGRIVYGGGGITPDVPFKPPKLTKLETELERKALFFDFAVHYTAYHKNITPDFEVDEQILEAFKEFLEAREFTYKTRVEEELDKLKEIVADYEYSESLTLGIADLKTLAESEKKKDFERSREYIEMGIKREIVAKLWGEKMKYEKALLPYDPSIAKARELILDEERYFSLLNPRK